MSTYVSNRDGGQTDEQGHYRFQTKVWSGNVLQGFATSQNSPLGMSVIVSQGDIKINYSSYAYTAFSDSDTVVTITTANGSNPRIDRLVAYIDRGMTPSPLSPNNPNMLKFKVIAGVPGAIPVRPSDSDVNTDVGPSNPWTSLSDILVDTSVTTITNSKITDKRNFVTVGADTVTTAAISDEAVSGAKIANTTIPDIKLLNGKVKHRQGGSPSNWTTVGTTNYNTSAENVKIQVGSVYNNASPKTITFPEAFTQPPIVLAQVASVNVNACFVVAVSITTTNFACQVYTDAGATNSAQDVRWIAIGV